MFDNLLDLNLYLAANVMLSLAFLTYAWLYVDLYLKEKKNFSLLRSLGSLLLSTSFLIPLGLNINSDSIEINITMGMLFTQTVGLGFVGLSHWSEKIPLLPKIKKNKKGKLTTTLSKSKKRKNKNSVSKYFQTSLLPVVISFPVSFLQSTYISAMLLYKVTGGLSKEFRLLAYSWLSLTFLFFYQFTYFIAKDSSTWINVNMGPYTFLWRAQLILMILIALLIFTWIYKFISFRVFTKIFLSVWQLSILLSVVVASVFTIFNIESTEDQIFDLLGDTTKLVGFNIEEIETNSDNILSSLSNQESFIRAVERKDTSGIAEELDNFINLNNTIDKAIVTDATGLLIYDSERVQIVGETLSDNRRIKSALLEGKETSEFGREKVRQGSQRITLSLTHPIVKENKVIGSITAIKRIDDLYLDTLKKRTDQELIVYVDGIRSASTILQADGISRLENIPQLEVNVAQSETVNERFKAEYGTATIVTTPYYVSRLQLGNPGEEKIGEIILGSEQRILLESTQNTLERTFLIALLISLIATIPSFYLAKGIDDSSKA